MTYEEMKAERMNEVKGNLKYYDCPICLNRGYTAFVKEGIVFTKFCECKELRKTYSNLENCGISKDVLERYSFENYECKEDYQKRILSKAKENVSTNNWFVITGISGLGKTMICTAIFKKEIMNGKKGRYMLWRDKVTELKSLKKQFNPEPYEEIINELSNVDVLYIDDYLKFCEGENLNGDLDIAFQILNARYINNKKTIISSEIMKEEMEKLDRALFGRINERSKGFWLDCIFDTKRDYRNK